jgi:hypothetical protein
MTYTAKAYFKHGHDDDPVNIESAKDVEALLDMLFSEPLENSVAALYVNDRPLTELGFVDHSLRIAI